MSNRKVIQVWGVVYEVFIVSYFDGKEWIDATGPWQGILNVHPFYTDVNAAKMVAKQLNELSGYMTRVEKEERE